MIIVRSLVVSLFLEYTFPVVEDLCTYHVPSSAQAFTRAAQKPFMFLIGLAPPNRCFSHQNLRFQR